MGVATSAEGDQSAAAKLLQELRDLNRDLAVPTPAAYGIDPATWDGLLPTMAAQALASGSPANNPAVPTAEEITALYRRAWAG
jgi:alcohol dehydrogenase class IV